MLVSNLRSAAVVLLCAWVGQYLLAMATPRLIMEVLHRTVGERYGHNTLNVGTTPDASFRDVVRPSPDLIYGVCAYDLTDGPVAISADVPRRYWSMQFYQMNTNNFAGFTNKRGDETLAGETFKVTLVGPAHRAADHSGTVVRSPTDRGVMLLRASAIGDSDITQTAVQRSTCEAVGIHDQGFRS